MTPLEVQWREPERFAAGDTLAFNKRLPAYLPSAGWAIRLTVSKALPEGGAQNVTWVMSVPDPTNSFHTFAVAQFIAGTPVGEYILSMEAVNAANGNEQHQIYYNDHFIVGPNIIGGAAGQLKSPYELLLVAALEKMAYLESIPLSETDQQRNRFVVEDKSKTLERIKFYEAKVLNERQCAQARNGRMPSNTQEAVFAIG